MRVNHAPLARLAAVHGGMRPTRCNWPHGVSLKSLGVGLQELSDVKKTRYTSELDLFIYLSIDDWTFCLFCFGVAFREKIKVTRK